MLTATMSSSDVMTAPYQMEDPGAGVVRYWMPVPNSRWYNVLPDHVEYPASMVWRRSPSFTSPCPKALMSRTEVRGRSAVEVPLEMFHPEIWS